MAMLPLFPLGSALLPGAPLPLQIFEPRYVMLLRDLLGDQGVAPVFGVVGIRQGFEVGDRENDLYDVGCTAVVEQVGELGDGVFALMATGGRRFRLETLVEDADTPYDTGVVAYLDEPLGDPGQSAAISVKLAVAIQGYRSSRGLLPADPPTDPTALSYWAARALELAPNDAQLLLASPDTVTRLGIALRIVHREAALGAQLGVLGTIPGGPPSLN